MSIFSRLFARKPAYHESSYGRVYPAVVERLSRTGVKVGRTAQMPRVEVHSITEGERMDKEGLLREVHLTVESMSNASYAQAESMNEENIELLTSELVLPDGWECIGVIPDQLQDLTETSDTQKIVYRLLQSFTLYVMRIKAQENN